MRRSRSSSFSGLSSEDDDHKVVVFSNDQIRKRTGDDDAKSFMSSKAPKQGQGVNVEKDDAEDETMNIKNDRALQRLLRESELLAQLKPIQGDKRPLRMKSTEAAIIQLGGQPDRRKQLPFKEAMQRMKEETDARSLKAAEDRAAGIIGPKDRKYRQRQRKKRDEDGIKRSSNGQIQVSQAFAERIEAKGSAGKRRKLKTAVI